MSFFQALCEDGMPFNPSILSPFLWIDSTDPNHFTASIDYIRRIIDTVTTKDSLALTSTPLSAGAIGQKPFFNVVGHYHNGSTGYTLGTTSTFNAMHQAGNKTFYISFYQIAGGSGTVPIWQTAANGTNRGTRWLSGRTNKTLEFRINDGAAPAISLSSSTNSVDDDAWNWAKVTWNGTTATLYVNGVLEATDSTVAFGSGNAGQVFTMGATTGAFNGYHGQSLYFNSLLSAGNQTSMDTWITDKIADAPGMLDINLYLLGPAQSNGIGHESIANAPADLLNVPISSGASTFCWTLGFDNASDYWDLFRVGFKLVIGSNVDDTEYGGFQRFAKRMNDAGHDCALFLVGYDGSSEIIQGGTDNDWNIGSASECLADWKLIFDRSLLKMRHVLRRNPIPRGLITMQGERDSQLVGAGAVYETNFTNTIDSLLDHIDASFDIGKLRLYVNRVQPLVNSADPTSLAGVRTAQEDVGDTYSTTDPRIIGSTWADTDGYGLQGDDLHYDAAGYDSMGDDEADYFIPFVNE